MPPIHHLFSTGRAFAGSTSVFPGTISANPLDAGMGAKPIGKGFCGSIRQQIHWAMMLPVDEQGSVREATTKRKIIYSKNLRDDEPLCRSSFGKSQERISAHLRASCFEQPRSWLCSTLNGVHA